MGQWRCRRGKVLGQFQVQPLTIALKSLYKPSCGHDHGDITLAYENPLDMDKFARRAIRRVWRRKLKAGDIDANIAKANAEKIWEGVLEGFKNPSSYSYGSAEQRLLIQLRYNVHVTAAFKSHHNTLEWVRALFDQDGKMRPWKEFHKEALKIDKVYNTNHLMAEYRAAVGSAQMAEKWARYKSRGGSLEYRTVRDDRVRVEHRELEGATYPVDHVFWKNHYPPNDWGCRCYVIWKKDSVVKEAASIPEVPKAFRNNVGESGKIFTKDSPYFEVDGRFKEKAEKLFGYRPPVDPDRFKANLKFFESLKENKDFIMEFADNLNGSFIFRHKKASKRELKDLVPTSKALAKNETSAIIINEVSKTPGAKNPDLTINGIAVEVKTNKIATANAIDSAIREANYQAGRVVLNIQSNIEPHVLELAIYNRARRSSIQEIKVIYKDTLYTLSRQEIINKSFFGKIK